MEEQDKDKTEKEILVGSSFLSELVDPKRYRDAILLYLQTFWKEFVGQAFAAHSLPNQLYKKTKWQLRVAVDHGMWSTELLFNQEKILKSINKNLIYAGIEIKKLSFIVKHNISFKKFDHPDKSCDGLPSGIEEPGMNEKSKKTNNKIENLLKDISDPKLKKSLEYIASLIQNREKRS